jgi:hypothetical protein
MLNFFSILARGGAALGISMLFLVVLERSGIAPASARAQLIGID